MKKLILLISTLFIIPVLSAFSQPTDRTHIPVWLLDEKPEFTRSEILQLPAQMSLFSASTESRLASATKSFLTAEDEWNPYSRFLYTYKDGYVTEFLRQEQDHEGEWVSFSKIEATYAQNNLESFTYFEASMDGVSYYPLFKAVYEYTVFSSFETATQVSMYEWSDADSEWKPDAIIQFHFDEEVFNGLTEQFWYDDEWHNDFRIIVDHDTDNKLTVTEQFSAYNEQGWINEYRTVFEVLNDPNDLLKIIGVFLGDMSRDMRGHIIPPDMTEFQWFHEVLAPDYYHWINMSEYYWDDDNWVKEIEVTTNTSSDSEYFVAQILGLYYYDGEPMPDLNFTLYYDPVTYKPVRTESLEFDFDSEEWFVYFTEEYLYDNENPHKVMLYSVDRYADDTELQLVGRIQLVWGDEAVSVQPEFTDTPGTIVLHQNYPNPFNPITTISFELATNSPVFIDVYTSDGRHVAQLANEYYQAGSYSIRFDASNLSSGIYFYRLHAGNQMLTGKMTLIK